LRYVELTTLRLPRVIFPHRAGLKDGDVGSCTITARFGDSVYHQVLITTR